MAVAEALARISNGALYGVLTLSFAHQASGHFVSGAGLVALCTSAWCVHNKHLCDYML
jgi:hypothetical protein